MKDYESYLICDHGISVDFYLQGIQVAIFHRNTGMLEVKNERRLKEFCAELPPILADTLSAFRASSQGEPGKSSPKPTKSDSLE